MQIGFDVEAMIIGSVVIKDYEKKRFKKQRVV
jgi:hypothetical protein